MLKKVSLSNINTGRTTHLMVDTDSDEKAIAGAGKAANEEAKVVTVTGIDESIQRATAKSGGLDDRAALGEDGGGQGEQTGAVANAWVYCADFLANRSICG